VFKVFQVFHLDVANVDLDVAYVSNGYTGVLSVSGVCKYFIRMFQGFQLFRMYVTIVSFGCCKRRSGIAHVAMGLTCHSRLLQLLGRRRGSSCERLWLLPHGFSRAGVTVRAGSNTSVTVRVGNSVGPRPGEETRVYRQRPEYTVVAGNMSIELR
jgi:hypothetical protein